MNILYDEFAKQVDAKTNLEDIKAIRKEISVPNLRNEFWTLRRIVLKEKDEVEKEKAFVKARFLQVFVFGCTIPIKKSINRFKAPHGLFGIFISERAKLGKNCVIFQGVTIGSNTLIDSKNSGFPVIGNNVYIGAGAKIIGDVKVGDNCRIGANACVVKDVPPNSVVIGNPMKVIDKYEPLDNRFFTPKQFSELIRL